MNPDIEALLADPDRLITKKPFFRRINTTAPAQSKVSTFAIGAEVPARLPQVRFQQVTQERFLREYDPWSHDVINDENIPCIHVKAVDGGYITVEQKRMPIPFQKNIVKKQTLHLCNNPMSHIMLDTNPTDIQSKSFMKIKQMWEKRNMDGLKTDMVTTQKSQGDAGMLFYYDYRGRVKARILRFSDGYQICTKKDKNGDHILECLYYAQVDEDGNETYYIDCYDDTYMTRFTRSMVPNAGATQYNDSGWVRHKSEPHGFSECPLITKRGDVAWNDVQDIIEVYERTYNTFMVVQNRYGWGILYVKGKFNDSGKKVAGSVVLNDNSMNEQADAKFLTPPSPQNMIETLDQMEYSIQKGSGSTFILPKDIKLSGDTSGVAIQLTQELDIETALKDVITWQNVANKMMRLFKEGIAKELVKEGEWPTAVTDFENVHIHSKFVVWRPQSNESYNQMLTTLKQAGGLSQQTLVEKNTESTPDEMARIQSEVIVEDERALQQAKELAKIKGKTSEETIVTEK